MSVSITPGFSDRCHPGRQLAASAFVRPSMAHSDAWPDSGATLPPAGTQADDHALSSARHRGHKWRITFCTADVRIHSLVNSRSCHTAKAGSDRRAVNQQIGALSCSRIFAAQIATLLSGRRRRSRSRAAPDASCANRRSLTLRLQPMTVCPPRMNLRQGATQSARYSSDYDFQGWS